MSTPEASTASSGRQWTARLLLGFVALWAVAKVIEILSDGISARALDITNPSGLGILAFVSFVAYFFVRPGKQTGQTGKTAAPVDYAPASKTRCDQCGKSFPSGYYLAKSQDNRYLCEACRTESDGV
jgi:hypothetical protein